MRSRVRPDHQHFQCGRTHGQRRADCLHDGEGGARRFTKSLAQKWPPQYSGQFHCAGFIETDMTQELPRKSSKGSWAIFRWDASGSRGNRRSGRFPSREGLLYQRFGDSCQRRPLWRLMTPSNRRCWRWCRSRSRSVSLMRFIRLNEEEIVGAYRFRTMMNFSIRDIFPAVPSRRCHSGGIDGADWCCGLRHVSDFASEKCSAQRNEGPLSLFSLAEDIEFKGIVRPGERVIVRGKKYICAKGH